MSCEAVVGLRCSVVHSLAPSISCRFCAHYTVKATLTERRLFYRYETRGADDVPEGLRGGGATRTVCMVSSQILRITH